MPAMTSSLYTTPYAQIPSSYCKQQQSHPESLLFTPPLSPTEEQLLAFLIPDIDPRELAAYLSNPSSPTVSTDVVSGLLIDTRASSPSASGAYLTPECQSPSSTTDNGLGKTVAELVPYPSPVCQAAAATVVAIDRLDILPRSSFTDIHSRKRCSTYAFDEDEDDEVDSRDETEANADDETSFSCSFVMSSQNTRKRLLLEQPFVSPDEDLLDESSLCSSSVFPTTCHQQQQDGYAHLFDGAASVADQDVSVVPSMDLSSPIAFDLVLA